MPSECGVTSKRSGGGLGGIGTTEIAAASGGLGGASAAGGGGGGSFRAFCASACGGGGGGRFLASASIENGTVGSREGTGFSPGIFGSSKTGIGSASPG